MLPYTHFLKWISQWNMKDTGSIEPYNLCLLEHINTETNTVYFMRTHGTHTYLDSKMKAQRNKKTAKDLAVICEIDLPWVRRVISDLHQRFFMNKLQAIAKDEYTKEKICH